MDMLFPGKIQVLLYQMFYEETHFVFQSLHCGIFVFFFSSSQHHINSIQVLHPLAFCVIGSLVLKKAKLQSSLEHEYINNFKLVQGAFIKTGCDKVKFCFCNTLAHSIKNCSCTLYTYLSNHLLAYYKQGCRTTPF